MTTYVPRQDSRKQTPPPSIDGGKTGEQKQVSYARALAVKPTQDKPSAAVIEEQKNNIDGGTTQKFQEHTSQRSSGSSKMAANDRRNASRGGRAQNGVVRSHSNSSNKSQNRANQSSTSADANSSNIPKGPSMRRSNPNAYIASGERNDQKHTENRFSQNAAYRDVAQAGSPRRQNVNVSFPPPQYPQAVQASHFSLDGQNAPAAPNGPAMGYRSLANAKTVSKQPATGPAGAPDIQKNSFQLMKDQCQGMGRRAHGGNTFNGSQPVIPQGGITGPPVYGQVWPTYDQSADVPYGYNVKSGQFIPGQQQMYYGPDNNGQIGQSIPKKGPFSRGPNAQDPSAAKTNKVPAQGINAAGISFEGVTVDYEDKMKAERKDSVAEPLKDGEVVASRSFQKPSASPVPSISPLRKREKKIIAIVNPETNEEIKLPPLVDKPAEDKHTAPSPALDSQTNEIPSTFFHPESLSGEEMQRRQEQLRNEILRLKGLLSPTQKTLTTQDTETTAEAAKAEDTAVPESRTASPSETDDKPISAVPKHVDDKQAAEIKQSTAEDINTTRTALESELKAKESVMAAKELEVAVEKTTSELEEQQKKASQEKVTSARESVIESVNSSVPTQSSVHVDVPLKTAPKSKTGLQRYAKSYLLKFKDIFTKKPTHDWDKKIKDIEVGDSTSHRSNNSSRTGDNYRNRGGSSHHDFSFGNFSGRPTVGRSTADRTGPGITGRGFIGGISSFRTAASNVRSTPSSGRERESHRKSSQRSRRGDAKKEQDHTLDDDVKPLEVTAGGWRPHNLGKSQPSSDNHLDAETVQRKVKAALNKLTLDKFDKISDQILEIAMQSRDESDGRTLRQVIQLTFEKATDEPNFSNMYARFCRKMMEKIDDSIKDDNIMDKNNEPVKGGMLFRKYLLNRCQENFERGWKVDMMESDGSQPAKEAEMLSDEYYVLAAAKRRGLGLVRFIGELYNLGMLSKRIMLECLQRLLANVKEPEEEEVESLCKLLPTIGKSLDEDEKTKSSMMVYFQRIEEMKNAPNLPSRFKFMIQDVIDMRKRHWRSSEMEKGPKTIQEIHDEAERQAQAHAAASQRACHLRSSTGRGPGDYGDRGLNRQKQSIANEGWSKNDARFGQLRLKQSNAHGPSNLMQMMRSHSRGSKASSAGQPISKNGSQSSSTQTSSNKFDLLIGGSEAQRDSPDSKN